MKRIIKLLNAPYPYYIPFSRSIGLLTIFSIIVPVFLIVFKPFGLNNWSYEWRNLFLAGMGVPIFLTLSFNFYGISALFSKFFNENTWSIWKEIIWSIWNFITIAITTSFYWFIVPHGGSFIHWGEQLSRVFLLGLLPIVVCIYFNYSSSLKRKLKKAKELNARLQMKISYYEHGKLTLVAENNTDMINLSTETLVLIQSFDNYAEIKWVKSGDQTTELIRSSLKHLEPQIQYPFILRCHRSFIVNLAKVEEVVGNARDFHLKLQTYPDWIPVSREAYKKIASLLNEYAPKTKTPVSYSFDRNNK